MADKQVVTKPAGRALLLAVDSAQLRKDIPEIKSGDTVRLQVKVVEGNRERLQPFEGVVMRLRGGGVNRNFTVRRITHGVGVNAHSFSTLLALRRLKSYVMHACAASNSTTCAV